MESASSAAACDRANNKENTPPPAASVAVKESNHPVSVNASASFKKKTTRRRLKNNRVPLADITNLFRDSSVVSIQATEQRNVGAVSSFSSTSALLWGHSISNSKSSKKRTADYSVVVVDHSKHLCASKSLRIGFR